MKGKIMKHFACGCVRYVKHGTLRGWVKDKVCLTHMLMFDTSQRQKIYSKDADV